MRAARNLLLRRLASFEDGSNQRPFPVYVPWRVLRRRDPYQLTGTRAQVMPGADLVPTGGIALDAVGEWLHAGACAVGVGSDLLRPGAADRLAALLASPGEHAEGP